MTYITDQELRKLIQAARLPADVAVRLGQLLSTVGTPGPPGATGATGPAGADGADGATGPAGPAPPGTGYVHVTGGVLDTPSASIPQADVTDLVTDLGTKVETASNLGAGADTFKQKTGTDLEFRSIVAGSGISVTENTNDVTVATTFLPSADWIYGDGSDGTATMDGAATIAGLVPSGNIYTASRDLHFVDLTIDSGVTLLPSGYRVFVQGTLTLNGSIKRNGANGANGANAANTVGNVPGGAGGAALSANVLPGGTAGGNGAGTSASTGGGATGGSGWPWRGNGGAAGGGAVGAGSNGTGGVGTGTAGGPGGGGGGGGGDGTNAGSTGAAGGNIVAVTNQSGTISSLPQCLTGRRIDATGVIELGTGGGGGGRGENSGTTTEACGGGGGGSGAMVVVCAYEITGSGSITANGGNGGNGGAATAAGTANAGGGGGGGGGSGGMVVVIITEGSFPTCTATGGMKGTGGVGKGTGGNGGDGGNGANGVVLNYRIA